MNTTDALVGIPPRIDEIPELSPAEFAGMRVAGRLAADTLDLVTGLVRPGVTTNAIDAACHEFMTARGGIPAPLHYNGFPKSV